MSSSQSRTVANIIFQLRTVVDLNNGFPTTKLKIEIPLGTKN